VEFHSDYFPFDLSSLCGPQEGIIFTFSSSACSISQGSAGISSVFFQTRHRSLFSTQAQRTDGYINSRIASSYDQHLLTKGFFESLLNIGQKFQPEYGRFLAIQSDRYRIPGSGANKDGVNFFLRFLRVISLPISTLSLNSTPIFSSIFIVRFTISFGSLYDGITYLSILRLLPSGRRQKRDARLT